MKDRLQSCAFCSNTANAAAAAAAAAHDLKQVGAHVISKGPIRKLTEVHACDVST